MNRKAYFAVLLAASLAGLSGLFIKHMSIGPTSMAWIRTTLPTLFMGSIFLVQRRNIFRRGYKKLLLASVLNVGRMFFFFYAFVHTTIGNATLILFTWPAFVVVMSALFLKEKINGKQVMLLAMAMIGIAIVYAQDLTFSGSDFLGMSAALAAALFYSITVIIFKSDADNFEPGEMIFFQNVVGSLVFFPFFIINHPLPTSLDWAIASGHALFLGTFAFFLFFYGLKRMNASRAAMIAYVEIVVALTVGVLVMHEPLTLHMIVGGMIIVLSTYLLRRS